MNNALPRSVARPLLPAAALAAFVTGLVWAAPARAHDYPTSDRVLYVEACMAEHPGPRFEMLSKCSCALDAIAEKVPFTQFETMQTATNAFSIGGERGNYIRDTEKLTDEIKRFRELQTSVKKGCFIKVEGK